MGFFEFDEADEWVEAAPPPAPRPSSPPARRPAPSPAPTPRPTGGTGTSRPTTPASRPTTPGGRPPTTPGTRPDSRPSTTPSSGGSSFGAAFDRLGGLVTQGIGIATQVAPVVQQFTQRPSPSGPSPSGPAPAPAPSPSADVPFPIAPGAEPSFGGYPPVAAEPEPAAPPAGYGAPMSPPPSYGAPAPMTPAYGAPAPMAPQGFDQLGALLQALQQRQIPPLPMSGYAPPAYPGYPQMAPPNDPMQVLRSIVGNPQFQQALQWSAAMGPAGPRNVHLPVPAPGYPGDVRSVAIPMGAVMNTVSTLANQSRNQINATTREDEAEVPEYLVDDHGGFIVDPASSDDRAALVAHLFRLSDEAYRSGWFEAAAEQGAEAAFDKDREEEAEDETEDATELWAREAGFTR